ncbi:MAG: hypothetical protein WKF89_02915 [Chitinophagaceae bacterium]
MKAGSRVLSFVLMMTVLYSFTTHNYYYSKKKNSRSSITLSPGSIRTAASLA